MTARDLLTQWNATAARLNDGRRALHELEAELERLARAELRLRQSLARVIRAEPARAVLSDGQTWTASGTPSAPRIEASPLPRPACLVDARSEAEPTHAASRTNQGKHTAQAGTSASASAGAQAADPEPVILRMVPRPPAVRRPAAPAALAGKSALAARSARGTGGSARKAGRQGA